MPVRMAGGILQEAAKSSLPYRQLLKSSLLPVRGTSYRKRPPSRIAPTVICQTAWASSDHRGVKATTALSRYPAINMDLLRPMAFGVQADSALCRLSNQRPGRGRRHGEDIMDTDWNDQAFGTTAMRKGFITRVQLGEALIIQAIEARSEGEARPIGRILLNAGHITLPQAGEVIQSLGDPLRAKETFQIDLFESIR